MKRYIVVFALLAVALAGCGNAFPGNEVVCSPSGELFYHYAATNSSAQSIDNKRQYCSNQADGSIVIKYRDQGDSN